MARNQLQVFFFVIIMFSSLVILLVRYISLHASVHPYYIRAADKISYSIKSPHTSHRKQAMKFQDLLSSKQKVHKPREIFPSPTGKNVLTRLQSGRVSPKKAKQPLASNEMPPMKVDSRLTEFDIVHNFSDTYTAKYIYESAVHTCEGVLCLNLLTEQERKAFYGCWKNSMMENNRRQIQPDKRKLHQASGACHFRYGKGLGRVGLVSFPGSGNTWVRDLLQRATGVCTGSYYCDSTLRIGGFDGEGDQSSSVVAIKAHISKPFWTTKFGQLEHGEAHITLCLQSRVRFDSVILLIRNPFDAIVSEWNRVLATEYFARDQFGMQHTEIHNQTFFMANTKWKKFVRACIPEWKKYFNWLVDIPKGHTILLVRYEDLEANVTKEVKRMLEFLHYRATDQQLEQRLLAGVDAFKRSKIKKFQCYTLEDTTLVNSAIHSVEEFLQLELEDTLSVGEYVKFI